MSSIYCCCLCSNLCNDYKQMQNISGESTEFYTVTVKYFDPMLIADSGNGHTSTPGSVLCHECWSHIDDFHEFQNSVLKSRSRLLANKKTALLAKQDESNSLEILVNNTSIYDVTSSESCDMYQELCFFNNEITILKEESEPLPQMNEQYPAADEKSKFWEESSSDKINHLENSSRKSKMLKQTKSKSRKNKKIHLSSGNSQQTKPLNGSKSVYTLEKGRQIDSFIAEWKPNLECDLCPVSAPNFDSLRAHFREEHKSRFYIKCCDRKFYRRCILVDHIRLHVNPETHKCDVCGKSSTSKYNLKLHKKIVHNEIRDYECDVCHKNFNHKPTLDRHLLTHATGDKEFFCKHCDKGYIKEVQLNTHIRNVHNGVRICDQCGKTFLNLGSLKKHLIEHGVIPQPKFPCDTCVVVLKSNEALKRHRAAYHHDGTTVYVCSICSKVAASEHALLSHKKFVHENNRKHKCSFCEKAFRTATVLREHIATHTGEDLYKCPHCPQMFKTNANMHHHRKRIHPVEWKEARKNRLDLPKVNIDQLRIKVIL